MIFLTCKGYNTDRPNRYQSPDCAGEKGATCPQQPPNNNTAPTSSLCKSPSTLYLKSFDKLWENYQIEPVYIKDFCINKKKIPPVLLILELREIYKIIKKDITEILFFVQWCGVFSLMFLDWYIAYNFVIWISHMWYFCILIRYAPSWRLAKENTQYWQQTLFNKL